ncbi:helix-turn-helix domain-containing protein [Dyella sp. Tek66A03]|uniref:helix-turn-helix domain-containing protein n=1 Tax=Dyella sp. Tek66A03 TaxID=3458298 RepID=UPI00403EB7AF
MQSAYYVKQIAKRFHLPSTPTLVSGVAGVSPILASWLRCEVPDHGTADPPPRVDAYTIQIALRAIDSLEIRLLGRLATSDPMPQGGIFLFNLESNPVKTFHSSFELVRFEVSQAAIDALCSASDEKPVTGLKRPPFGQKDPILFHMARALVPSFGRADEVDSLFFDQVALALHSHLISTYAGPCVDPRPLRSGLTCWQIRRTTEMIEANMATDLTIGEISRECCLSPKHFARAFRRTFGVPPYQWLQERRVDRAQQLLRMNEMSLSNIAEACGFTSQSHFTRVFTTIVGASPGAWRRYMSHRAHILLGPQQIRR